MDTRGLEGTYTRGLEGQIHERTRGDIHEVCSKCKEQGKVGGDIVNCKAREFGDLIIIIPQA